MSNNKETIAWILIAIGLFLSILPHSIHLMIPILNQYQHSQHITAGLVALVIGGYLLYKEGGI